MDSKERRRRTNEMQAVLHKALVDGGSMFLKHSCEDNADFLRAVYAAFAIAVLTVQAKLDQSRQVTVDTHMRDQFVAVKNAMKGLSENNQAIWHEPPKLEG